jgi:hypothetical protein
VSEEEVFRLLSAVLWRGEPAAALDDPTSDALWAAASRNGVEGETLAAFGQDLAAVRQDVEARTDAFRRNLMSSTARLRAAGLAPLLIKADPSSAYVYSNFDVVLERQHWPAALAALGDWLKSTRQYPFEREKLFLVPDEGPALHLHASISWYDIPSLSTALARERARSATDDGWLRPCPVDELKILVAHIGFQTLAPTLSEVLHYRKMGAELTEEAATEARREGWGAVFAMVAARLTVLATLLDAGEAPALPTALPAARSIAVGVAHAGALARHGQQRAAARALALRVPLVLAKQR